MLHESNKNIPDHGGQNKTLCLRISFIHGCDVMWLLEAMTFI